MGVCCQHCNLRAMSKHIPADLSSVRVALVRVASRFFFLQSSSHRFASICSSDHNQLMLDKHYQFFSPLNLF